MGNNKGISGALSCWGYGYNAKVLVNGKDTGIAGGGSEGVQLFSKEHMMYAEAAPEIRERQFILKEGDNEISVEYEKIPGNENGYLQITLEMWDYPAPIFIMHSRTRASGAYKGIVRLSVDAPADFKPVFITDLGEGKGAILHVETSGSTVTPMLNGEKKMALMMRGQVVLDDVKPGLNRLSVAYSGEAGGELRFALMTPEWTRHFVRKIAGASEKTEDFSFSG